MYVQRRAEIAFELWQRSPSYPSLQFKLLHTNRPIMSVRVGRDWRAVGTKRGDTVVWFWIGSHADYDELIKHL
jgi:hypothetical protein